MQYPDCKVYSDGSHYIAIPYEPNPRKRSKPKPEEVIEIEDEPPVQITDKPPVVITCDTPTPDEKEICAVDEECKPTKKAKRTRRMTRKELFEELYQKSLNLKRSERQQYFVENMIAYFPSLKTAEEYVSINIARKERNMICRRTRLCRKINLADFNYFCTFTYDDKKHTADNFKKKLADCFKKMCYRKQWRYAGVWELSPKKQRLHFHGLFDIPEGSMPGEMKEISDYNTTKHKRQIVFVNSYFLERFGRNDFKAIESKEILGESIQYLVKYLEKTGGKIVYSKNLPQYFISDIMEEDVVCKIGQEDKKLLLFDDFGCWNEGEYIGKVSAETIAKLRKSN